jgi:nitrate/TMAO reductase-like tetraheme cytochrome c subunit
MSNCTKCHELGEQVYNSKCLDCHSEIKSLINSSSGYHASLEVRGKNCWSCHSEHHGRNFRIINFNSNSFNHNNTGYKLTGKHSRAECSDCHKSEFIIDNDLKKRKGTYLGLNENCFSCHEDYHRKSLGDNCTACHSTESFKPAAKFDHSTSAFKLTGAHLQVDCLNCHKIEDKSGKKYQEFKNIPFQNCNSCHKDAHNGRFGLNCKSCHLTTSFAQINTSAFDHKKTNFPLIGKHKFVGCNSCHKNPTGYKMKFELCTDCHEDYHNEQFIINRLVQNCSDCHTEKGFRPSLFTIEMHNKTDFEIIGAHLATPCESCHYQQNKWTIKGTGIACIDCHNNIHENELDLEFMPDKNCTACHKTDGWSTITFDHSKTKFALNGVHNKISCGTCHRMSEVDNQRIIFSSLNKDCETCHNDIHLGQFKTDNTSDCSRCHSFNNWNPEKFYHNETDFSLEGAHTNVGCEKCHLQVEENGFSFTNYKIENFKCATCHT